MLAHKLVYRYDIRLEFLHAHYTLNGYLLLFRRVQPLSVHLEPSYYYRQTVPTLTLDRERVIEVGIKLLKS